MRVESSVCCVFGTVVLNGQLRDLNWMSCISTAPCACCAACVHVLEPQRRYTLLLYNLRGEQKLRQSGLYAFSPWVQSVSACQVCTAVCVSVSFFFFFRYYFPQGCTSVSGGGHTLLTFLCLCNLTGCKQLWCSVDQFEHHNACSSWNTLPQMPVQRGHYSLMINDLL